MRRLTSKSSSENDILRILNLRPCSYLRFKTFKGNFQRRVSISALSQGGIEATLTVKYKAAATAVISH